MEFSSPGEVAGLILRSLFAQEAPSDPLGRDDNSGSGLDGDRTFPLHEFQETAARRARRIVRERGGVLVADSVGLGKTYIALALIEEELRKGGRVLVVIPAALRGVWRGPLQQLGRRLSVSGRIHIATHARLSRGGCADAHAAIGLVVVDEAHRFRNPATRRYQALARILDQSQALLLTATPVNNKVADLHHLLRLFMTDSAVRDLGIPSLQGAFDAAGGGDYREVRTILGAIMVRRSRTILLQDGRAAVGYPSRKTTRRVRYRDPDLSEIVGLIGKLELIPYRLGSVRHPHTSSCSSDAAALVRVGLLKRLESSRAAFTRTVETHIAFAERFLEAAARGRLVRPRDRILGDGGDDTDPHQLLLIDVLVEPAPPEIDLAAATRSVNRDHGRLKRLLALAQRRDPKLDALVDLCRKHHSERVLVFTEFRDTAAGLWQVLVKDMAVARVDGGGSWLGRRPSSRQAIIEAFAPASNGRQEPPDRERVDILVATDVLSEGANLQDARHVVSYDLPWNPVRLLQRIGRIDRLGSPHESIRIHLLAPPPALDGQLALARRLRSKLGGIAGTVGSEPPDRVLARVLTGRSPDDPPEPAPTGEPDHPLEVLRAAHEDVRKGTQGEHSTLCGDGEPGGAARPIVSFAHLPRPAAVLVLHGNRRWLLEWDNDGCLHSITTTGARRLSAIAGLSRPPARAAEPGRRDSMEATAIEVVEWIARDVRQHFEALRLKAAAPPQLRRNDVAARIARKVQARIETGGGADPSTLHRADRILACLAQPLPPAPAADAAELLRQPDLPLHQLLEELEGLVSALPAAPDRPPKPGEHRDVIPQVVAVLLDPRKLPSNPVDGTKNGG